MKKKLVAFACLLIMPAAAAAQDIKTEAIDSLETAKQLVENGNYNKAVEEIQYSLAKINELTAEGLLTYIPDPPEGYTLENKSSQGIGQGAAMFGNAGAKATYTGSDNSSINLNIAIGGVVGQMGSLAAFGSMFGAVAQEAGITSVRVNGYTGTLQHDKQQQSGSLTIQVGSKVSVQVQGEHIASPDVLKALAGKMDLAGLEKNF